jgi:hypothetical protein
LIKMQAIKKGTYKCTPLHNHTQMKKVYSFIVISNRFNVFIPNGAF